MPDKLEKAGFHATKSEFVDAPLINELPLAMECKVKSFEDGILVGEIVNVSADESVVTDGVVDIKKLKRKSHCIFVQLLKCFNKFSKALAVICLVSTEDAVETFLAVIRDPCKLATVVI